MGQRGITVLNKEHFLMTQVLKMGYPTSQEKFEYLWYGEQQKVSESKTVITEYFLTKVKRLKRNSPAKPTTQSKRLFAGRSDILIRYPKSGKVYKARIRSKSGIAALEPIEPNTAFWLVDKTFIDNFDLIDLNKIPHIRQIHNKEGREIMSDFR